MEPITYLVGSTILYFIGYYLGMKQGEKNGRSIGFNEGINVALKEIDRYMRGGLQSTLDWETAQRLLQEKMSKN